MTNKMLDFYISNNIVTEHIDISKYGEYVRKRKNLYRQLGIPILAIQGADVLEIGPGAGHNTLLLMTEWNANHIDMIEPNPVAVNELKTNFEVMNIDKKSYEIFSTTLEDFKGAKKYDIVIAEGYVQCADNWKEFLNIIKKYTHDNSIVIVTCSDEIGLYVERMKRVAGQYVVRNIEKLEDKVEQLDKLWSGEKFSGNLKGMTRSSKEWIIDSIFNEASISEHIMTMKDAMEEMEDKFYVLGASQNIFTDYSWYKDLSYDYIHSYKKQYDTKRHMFLVAGEDIETIRTAEENQKLEESIKNTIEYAKKMERGEKIDIEVFLAYIDKVSQSSDSESLEKYNEELKEILLLCAKGKEIEWERYNTWKYTFGKTMQYISFGRR